jgi:kynureninase
MPHRSRRRDCSKPRWPKPVGFSALLLVACVGSPCRYAALDVFDGVSMVDVRAKADALFTIFVREVHERAPELELLTPTDPARRGTQVSLRHPEAYAVMQALIARGVIGDFREPDILRFGLTPLNLGYVEVERAAQIVGEVVRERAWDRPEFKTRAKVV